MNTILLLFLLLVVRFGSEGQVYAVKGTDDAGSAHPKASHLSPNTVLLHQYALIQHTTFLQNVDEPEQYRGGSAWGFFQWKNGRFEAAMDVFRDLTLRHSQLFAAHFWFGTMHTERGWTFHGYEGLSRAIALGPRNPEAWNNLGVAAELLADKSRATVPPGMNPEFDIVGGWGEWNEEAEKGRLEEALEDYSYACQLVDEDALLKPVCSEGTCAISCVNSARVEQRLGRFNESRRWLELAVKNSPKTSCVHRYATAQIAWFFDSQTEGRRLFNETLSHPECVFPVPPGALDVVDLESLRVERFSRIYETAFWGYQKSGPGSSLKETSLFRTQLQRIIDNYNITSIFDIGCGDWTWMPHVNLSNVDYHGVDIVPQLIADNRAAAVNLLANRTAMTARSIAFDVLDAVSNPLPKKNQDLVICREVLIHLPMRDIVRLLRHISDSGASLLITDMDERVAENSDRSQTQFALPGAGWRGVNLLIPPFNLPAALELLDRGARLWRLPFTNMEDIA